MTCAISSVPKPKVFDVPRMVAAATNSSIMETPVTISGFIMGILVTVCTAPRSQRLRMVCSPSAPKVPMTVAISAALTASTTELRREVSASSSANSSRYHFSDTPVKDARLPPSLKENIISTRMGTYSRKKMRPT